MNGSLETAENDPEHARSDLVAPGCIRLWLAVGGPTLLLETPMSKLIHVLWLG